MPQPGEGSGSPGGTVLVPPEPPVVPVVPLPASVVPMPALPPTPVAPEVVLLPDVVLLPADVVLVLVTVVEMLPAEVLAPPGPAVVVPPSVVVLPFVWPLVAVASLVGPPMVLVAASAPVVVPAALSSLAGGVSSDEQAIAQSGAAATTKIFSAELPVCRWDVMLDSLAICVLAVRCGQLVLAMASDAPRSTLTVDWGVRSQSTYSTSFCTEQDSEQDNATIRTPDGLIQKDGGDTILTGEG